MLTSDRMSAALRALRFGVALSEPAHVACLRLSGEQAFDAFDAICPADLYLRDGQLMQTLLLDDEARPVVDLTVACDDEDLILFAEGLPSAQLVELLRAQMPAPLPDIVDLRADHELLSISGPYAWELVAELVGPEVAGVPYLSMFDATTDAMRAVGFRAGKTGEYGYDLLVARADAAAARQRIAEVGRRFALTAASTDELDLCALEGFFFNIRREGRTTNATPIELQLQWRVSYRKQSYPGAAALARRRREGARQRLTMLVCDHAVDDGERIVYGHHVVGHAVASGYSPLRDEHVVLAMLERDFAWPGHTFAAASARDLVLRSIAAPAVRNRSLFVSAEHHRFATREDDLFPSIVGERRPR